MGEGGQGGEAQAGVAPSLRVIACRIRRFHANEVDGVPEPFPMKSKHRMLAGLSAVIPAKAGIQ